MKFKVKYGVPQRSCIGPLVFVLYASKLLKIIERHLLNVHAYADVTQLYIVYFMLTPVLSILLLLRPCKTALRLSENRCSRID